MSGTSCMDPLIGSRDDKTLLNVVITLPSDESPVQLSKIYGGFLIDDDVEIENNVRNTIKKIQSYEVSNNRRKLDRNCINELIDLGLKINYIDQKWYGWEAIHYAAYDCNELKLEQICERLGPTRINTLTVLSENALHILLEHGRLAKTFNLACQNGLDLKMMKVINKEQQETIKCVKILTKFGIDVNHNNFWNETPILIAIKRKYFDIANLLCEVEGIDLDSCRDAVCGKTARELLKEKKMLPKQSSKRDDKILFQLLKAGDEEKFLKFKGGKIKNVANSYDGDNELNSSCTLLQYCFRRGLIAWYQKKQTMECDIQQYQDITANRLVQVFCQSGMAKCIQHLLDNEANVDFSLRKFENGRSLLEVAIIKSYYPFVALILGRKDSKLTPEKILRMCNAMKELLESANATNTNDLNNTLSVVLSRLLDAEEHFDSRISKKLLEILQKGVKIINQENTLLLLKFPGSLSKTVTNTKKYNFLGCTTRDKKTVLEDINPETLKTHFDDCVEQRGQDIYINYDSFILNNSVIPVLNTFLAFSELETYLSHVVFKILIMRKWNQLHFQLPWCKKKYFYFNLFFHIIFYFLLNVYILFKFNDVSEWYVSVIWGSGFVCLSLFALKEIFQCAADPCSYFKEFNNYVEIFFIIVTYLVYTVNEKWVDAASVSTVLTSNLVLLLLLQQVPKFAKYTIILQTIVYYLWYIIFYFVQFLAFAICFYILFSKSDQYFLKDLPDKLFETVILFTGNLDYMETPWKQESSSIFNSTANSTTNNTSLYHDFGSKEFFSKLIFILFVLFIAIILQNLLLGLLASDMSNLHQKVKVFVQVKRAGFVVRLDTFLKSRPCTMFLPHIFNKAKRIDEREIIVKESDRKKLDDEEEQNLDFILAKKNKKGNILKKLYGYIRTKINERTCEVHFDINREVLERLELLEERLKNLHELNQFVKNK